MTFYLNELLMKTAEFHFPPNCNIDNLPSQPLYNIKQLSPGSIIFSNMDYFFYFDFLSKIKVPFILITVRSDGIAPYYDINGNWKHGYDILNNPYLIRWFSNNVDYEHEKLTAIPIGLIRNIPWIENKGTDNEYMSWYVNYINTHNAFSGMSHTNMKCNNKEKLLHCRFDNKNNIIVSNQTIAAKNFLYEFNEEMK